MISNNLAHINELIAVSAEKAQRNISEIKLVAVSKRFPVERIIEANNAGQIRFGENYIQEVILKNRKYLKMPRSILLEIYKATKQKLLLNFAT